MAEPGEFDNPYDGKDRAVYAEGFGRGYHAGRITAAALPDERLREADRKVILEWAKFTRDESAGYWGRREEDVYQRLLAAADREAPDECRAPHCWYEYGTPCGTCPVAPPVSDEQEKP